MCPRAGVPYPERVLCSLKNTIAMIEQKLGLKIEKVNGVGPDPSGNVTLVSGDSALTIEEDATQHQITVGLDRDELPTAAVTSVNGETGAVLLSAEDIPDGYLGDVETTLADVYSGLTGVRQSVAQERTRAESAESTLQTNINALAATVPESSITPDALKVVMRDNSGVAYAADPTNGATDKSLVTTNWISQTGNAAPNNLIHKSGVERMTATKQIYGGSSTHIELAGSFMPSSGGGFNEGCSNIVFMSNDNIEIGRIFMRHQGGVFKIMAKVYNHDGTYKEVSLIEADN